jgi:ABC-type methionine transport system permease subunit
MITSLNARIRRQSNVHKARRLIIISTILWLIFNIHAPIGFQQEARGCVASSNGFYSIFFLVTNIFVATVPFIVLISFTSLTLQSVIRTNGRRRQAVHPIELVQRNVTSIARITNNQQEQVSNKNLQLIRLSLIQVIFFVLLNFPNTVSTMYSFITATYYKSTDQMAIDNFFTLMASHLLYIHCAVC